MFWRFSAVVNLYVVEDMFAYYTNTLFEYFSLYITFTLPPHLCLSLAGCLFPSRFPASKLLPLLSSATDIYFDSFRLCYLLPSAV
jgi:hypothetical protein